MACFSLTPAIRHYRKYRRIKSQRRKKSKSEKWSRWLSSVCHWRAPGVRVLLFSPSSFCPQFTLCFLSLHRSNFFLPPSFCSSAAPLLPVSFYKEMSPPSPDTQCLINTCIIKPVCPCCPSVRANICICLFLKWLWGLMNITSGQTGTIKERQGKAHRKRGREVAPDQLSHWVKMPRKLWWVTAACTFVKKKWQ